MFDRMGKRKYAMPVVFIIVVACVMALMFWPLTHMQMRNMPMAVLSLDEGMETPAGTINVGDTLVASLTGSADEAAEGDETDEADDEDATIVWTQLSSVEELEEAIDNLDYYGALIVPAGYTVASMAAQTGAGEAMSLTMVVDKAKSPMVATMMSSSMATMFSQLGIEVDVQTIHQGAGADDEDDSASSGIAATNMMSGMMSQQLAIMPLCMMAMACSIILSRIFNRRKAATQAERWKTIGKQVVYALIASLLAAIAAVCMVYGVTGTELPIVTGGAFLWLAGFCLMLVFIGLFNISTALGLLGVLCVFLLAMMTGALPAEMLPAFWSDWVYPWAPQHFIGDGIRAILYLDAGVWNSGTLPLLIWGIAGVVITCLSALIPGKGARKAKAAAAATVAETTAN